MNAQFPSWLPTMAPVNPWTNNTFEILYRIFRRDLLENNLTYCGHNVWFFPEKEEDGKEALFWHLTSRSESPDTHHAPKNPRGWGASPMDVSYRLPDLRRCERLPWIRPMLLHCPDRSGDVLSWDYMESDRTIKTYVWLQQHDFVIIMKKLPDGQRRLITSFHLDHPNQRRKFMKKYNERLP